MLKANQDKINWSNLSYNKNAISILKANPDKINWKNIYYNSSIFYKKKLNII